MDPQYLIKLRNSISLQQRSWIHSKERLGLWYEYNSYRLSIYWQQRLEFVDSKHSLYLLQ